MKRTVIKCGRNGSVRRLISLMLILILTVSIIPAGSFSVHAEEQTQDEERTAGEATEETAGLTEENNEELPVPEKEVPEEDGECAEEKTDAGEEPDYFRLTSTGQFAVTVPSYAVYEGTLEYSEDKTRWTAVIKDTPIGSGTAGPSEQVLYFRGSGNTVVTGDTAGGWSITPAGNAGVAASGNIMTLLDYSSPGSARMGDVCFAGMFKNCTALTSGPELPATALTPYAYAEMFSGCTKLTTAPELPANSLAMLCYMSMFKDCTSLTEAPALMATGLTMMCYFHMFDGCSALVKAPELPATTLQSYCYAYMFARCTSLAASPLLPAQTLAPNCYNGMFSGCSGMRLVDVSFTQWDYENQSTLDWMNGVPSTGSFFCPDELMIKTGYDYTFPEGWTRASAAVIGKSLILEDKVSVKYYLKLSDGLIDFTSAKYMMKYAYHDVVMRYYDDGLVDANYTFTVPVYARDYAEPILTSVFCGNRELYEPYSVKTYCDRKIRENRNEDLVYLCRAILDYGSYMQMYKGETDASKLANYRQVPLILNDVTIPDAFADSTFGTLDGIRCYGKSLVLEDVIKINFYFELSSGADIDDYVFRCGNEVLTPVRSGAYYYVTADGLAAKDLAECRTVVCARSGSNAGAITCMYSPMAYACNKQNSETPYLSGLVRTMYLYWQYAKEYFG